MDDKDDEWLIEIEDQVEDLNLYDKDDNSEDEEKFLSHFNKRQKVLDFLSSKLRKDVEGNRVNFEHFDNQNMTKELCFQMHCYLFRLA